MSSKKSIVVITPPEYLQKKRNLNYVVLFVLIAMVERSL